MKLQSIFSRVDWNWLKGKTIFGIESALTGERSPLLATPVQVMHHLCGVLVQENLYKGTSLIRKHHPIGPYSRPMLRALWWS